MCVKDLGYFSILTNGFSGLRWLETLFANCEKNGFEHDIVDYYHVLKGKEYHSGMQK